MNNNSSMSSCIHGAILSLVFITLTSVVAAPAGHVVAVLALGGKDSIVTGSDERQLVDAIRGVARRNLPKAEGWTVLGKDALESRMSSGVDLSNCDDEQCILDIGRELKVDYVVSENIGRMGSHLQVYFSFYEIGSGQLKGSEWFRGKSIDEIIDALEASPGKLFGGSGESSMAKSADTSPGNSQTVIQGAPPETDVIVYPDPYYEDGVWIYPYPWYPHGYCCWGGGRHFYGGYRGHGGHGGRR